MTVEIDPPVVVGRADGRHGEVVLRRRGAGPTAILELIVNGSFAIDSAETGTEEELADLALAGRTGARVLVGGLGLGYTAAALLRSNLERLDVVELEPALLDWASHGLVPRAHAVLGDPRCRVHVGDVANVLTGRSGPAGPWDAVVLDVDNGPDFLLHADNARLYDRPMLQVALGRLVPGGVLVVWSQGRAPELLRTLRRLDPDATEHLRDVVRGRRRLEYALYRATAKPAEASASPDSGSGVGLPEQGSRKGS